MAPVDGTTAKFFLVYFKYFNANTAGSFEINFQIFFKINYTFRVMADYLETIRASKRRYYQGNLVICAKNFCLRENRETEIPDRNILIEAMPK